MSPCHLACVVEGDYGPHAAAMLSSVLATGDASAFEVHLLHGPDLAVETIDGLDRMVHQSGAAFSTHVIPDCWLDGFETIGFTGMATWYRLFLPEVLTEQDLVLFLDADLVAIESIMPLWSIDLGSSLVAAVTNVPPEDRWNHAESVGLSGPGAYFNAGVMLMNLDAMRKGDCTRSMVEYAKARRPIWRDQDALNAVLGGKRLELAPRWNCMNSMLMFSSSERLFGPQELAEARRQPAIRHFEGAGANKPWHYLCDHEQRNLYVRHRAETPWPDVQLEGRTPVNILKRLARQARRRAGAARRRWRAVRARPSRLGI